MRVRFAPSPTGSLHVGGARTALFNYLLARKSGGALVLRIEDTDAERNRPESEAAVIEDLRWLGLTWDEGPDTPGDRGPYRQSERGEIYAAAAEELLAADRAYPCFCTPEELERDQAEQKAAGVVATKYAGRCAELDEAGRAALRDRGRASALRLRLPPGKTVVRDAVHGEVTFEHVQLGDVVLVRSNGAPTYNFVAAVDDSAMAIDLVVRGDEHLANTPYQMLVLEGLGRTPPAYAHVPLILNEDHQKLSKRHNTVGVAQYRDQGYLPAALIDHLVLLGWSPGDDSEHWSLEELSERFTLERVGRAPSVYNAARLKAFNGRAIRALAPEELSAALRPFFDRAGLAAAEDDAWRLRFAQTYGEEFETLADAVPTAAMLLGSPPTAPPDLRAIVDAPAARAFLSELAARVRDERALTDVPAKTVVGEIAKAQGLPVKDAYVALRVALTGTDHGAPLAGMLELLGHARIAERTARFLA